MLKALRHHPLELLQLLDQPICKALKINLR
jgi:hypothetical protein